MTWDCGLCLSVDVLRRSGIFVSAGAGQDIAMVAKIAAGDRCEVESLVNVSNMKKRSQMKNGLCAPAKEKEIGHSMDRSVCEQILDRNRPKGGRENRIEVAREPERQSGSDRPLNSFESERHEKK